jgi:hypothetical protein
MAWWMAIPAAIGAIGTLKGMMDKPPGVPSLSDADLKRQNPSLWQELQELKAINLELDRLYNQRSSGANAGEIAQMAEARSKAYERQGNLGLIGSSAGAEMMGAQEAQMQNAVQERIARERQNLLGQRMQGRQAYAGMYQNAMAPVMAQANYRHQDQLAEMQARNQFFSGLLNTGANLYGQQMRADNLNDPEFLRSAWERQYGGPGYSYTGPSSSPEYVDMNPNIDPQTMRELGY